jgi:hypothetical protein
MFSVNLTLPHWHDPFQVSTGRLEFDSEVIMGN